MSGLRSFADTSVARRSFLRQFFSAVGAAAFHGTLGWASPSEHPLSDDEECQKGIQSLAPLDPKAGERFDDPSRGPRQLGFVRSALAVELDDFYVDFHDGFLRGPRCFHQSFVRAYVHEVLHFWQALSQGFITNLALQEWLDVQEFKQSGALKDYKGLLGRFAEPPKGAPFSAWELSESLCRYWDIHIMGPVRLLQERGEALSSAGNDARPYQAAEFDRLMTIEDAYAAPYRWALERWGSVASVLLFPIAGHFAMQTSRPVEVFLKVSENLAVEAQQFRGSIHENWRTLFPKVRDATGSACFSLTGSILTPGWDVIRRSALKESPIWRYYLRLLHTGAMTVGSIEKLDFCFSLPGDPENRGILVSGFLPAVTLFRNGRWFGESDLAKFLRQQDERRAKTDGVSRTRDELPSPQSLADSAEEIMRGYRGMRQRASLRRYGL